MTNPAAKIRESRYFLALLRELDRSRQPFFAAAVPAAPNATTVVSPAASVRDEVSYLLSAFLNAVYAATDHMKPVAGVEGVKTFKAAHPAVFDGKAGLRNLTVHEKHIAPAPYGYVPAKGGAVHLVFSQPATASAHLVFREIFYVEYGDEQLVIVDLGLEVMGALEAFAATYGISV